MLNLQDYLYEQIPISSAMGMTVVNASRDIVTLAAPLSPNINHSHTVFGGSASAIAILSAWTLLYVRLKEDNIPGRIVIRKNTMKYLRPMTDNFTATAHAPQQQDWDHFLNTYHQNRRAHIEVSSLLQCQDQKVGALLGDFVVIND